MPAKLKTINLTTQPKTGRRRSSDRSQQNARRDSGGRGGVERRDRVDDTGGSRSGGSGSGGRSGGTGGDSSTATSSDTSSSGSAGRTKEEILEGKKKDEKPSTFGSSSSSTSETAPASTAENTPAAVGEYDYTPYDLELLDKGVCSSYPIIISEVPFSNFYSRNNELSSTGQLYDIQNQIQDETVATADRLVRSYYTENDSARRAVQSLATRNTRLYNTIIESLSTIKTSKDQLVAVSSTIDIKDESYNKITNLISTTPSDDVTSVGAQTQNIVSGQTRVLEVNPTSSVLGQAFNQTQSRSSSTTNTSRDRNEIEFSVPSIPYSIDDIQSKDSFFISSIDDITRIAYPGAAVLSTSTLGYQALRSTLANIYYGIKTSGPKRPNESQDTLDVREISLTNIANYNTNLEYLAETANKRNASNLKNDIFINVGTTGIDNFWSDGYKDAESSLSGINMSTSTFVAAIESISAIASQISNTATNSTIQAGLNSSISPNGPTVSVVDTIDDNISFVYRDLTGKIVLLEDTKVPTTRYAGITTILEASTSPNIDTQKLYDRLNRTKIELENFANNKKAWLSNQISCFIIQTMMNEFANFFESSTWCDTSRNSKFSTARCIMFRCAASNSVRAKRVYSICNVNLANFYDLDDEEKVDLIFKNSYQSNNKNDTDIETWERKEKSAATFALTGDESLDDDGASTASFAKDMFSDTSSFGMFNRIVESIKSQFQINDTIENLIRQTSFLLFMHINTLIKADVELYVDSFAAGKNKTRFEKCTMKWSVRDAAAIVDCCRSCLTASSIDDVNFTVFTRLFNAPRTNEKALIDANFFKPIRKIASTVLQKYEDVKLVLAFYQSRLAQQQKSIRDVSSSYENITNAYAVYGSSNPASDASRVVSKYSTTESIVEALQRSTRYRALIPGTRIRSIATRSNNYRSIVKAAHKDYMTKSSAKLMAIGIPYGFFEQIRRNSINVADFRASFTYGIKVVAQSIGNSDSTSSVDVGDVLPFLAPPGAPSRFAGRDFTTIVTDLYDDFDSNRIVQTTSDSTIKVLYLNPTARTLLPITKSELSDASIIVYEQYIDYQINQSALESYFEDMYGLHLRYACNRNFVDITDMPEIQYAAEIVSQFNIPTSELVVNTTSSIEQEEQLIRSRVQAMIMMHEDFSTTYMLKELEAGPVFDKIHYVLVVDSKLPSALSQITAEVLV